MSTPTQLNLNSISTKLRLNLMSTSFQPQPQINLSLKSTSSSISTSTLNSTQYGCDIKATQSCLSCDYLMFAIWRSNTNWRECLLLWTAADEKLGDTSALHERKLLAESYPYLGHISYKESCLGPNQLEVGCGFQRCERMQQHHQPQNQQQE